MKIFCTEVVVEATALTLTLSTLTFSSSVGGGKGYQINSSLLHEMLTLASQYMLVAYFLRKACHCISQAIQLMGALELPADSERIHYCLGSGLGRCRVVPRNRIEREGEGALKDYFESSGLRGRRSMPKGGEVVVSMPAPAPGRPRPVGGVPPPGTPLQPHE